MELTCQSLIIDKIVLTNFRSFLGKHEIVLGYSPEKFVNIIEGPCGSGKSTIVEALQWAFNKNDPESSTQGLPILNRDVLKSLKNQKAEVSVQVFLSDENLDTRLKIERTCEYSLCDKDISLVADVQTVKKFKDSQWIDVDKKNLGESYPLSIWNGEQISADTIENSSPFLSTGDRILLWFSQMAVTRKSTSSSVPLILDSAFSRLDTMKRIHLTKSLKDNFSGAQLILIGSEREFEPMMDSLKSITNRQCHVGNLACIPQ